MVRYRHGRQSDTNWPPRKQPFATNSNGSISADGSMPDVTTEILGFLQVLYEPAGAEAISYSSPMHCNTLPWR